MVSGWVEARGGRRANADAAVPHSYTGLGGWVVDVVWVVETGLVGDYSVTWQGQKREYTQLFIMIYGMFFLAKRGARVWG